MILKHVAITLLFFALSACQKQDTAVSNLLKVGDCLDQALSPYVLKVAAIEGETIFFYHLGEMGKKIYQKPQAELLKGKSPFEKSSCP